MDKRNEKELIKIINSVKIKKIEGLQLGEAMFFSIHDWNGKYNNLISILRVARNCFFKLLKIVPLKGEILFLYSDTHKPRLDYMAWFNKVCNLCSSKVVISPQKKLSLRGFIYLPEFFSTFFQLRKDMFFNEALHYASIIYSAFCSFMQIRNIIDSNDFKVFVTLCDTYSVDSMVTQYANEKGIKTVSLAHGIYSSSSPGMRHSFCQYYLGYSEYMGECAQKSGLKAKFLSVGMPQLIDVALPVKIKVKNNKVIGVICSGYASAGSEDEIMISIATEFAKKNDYKLYVKLHPTIPEDLYEKTLMKNVDQVFYSEVSALQFADMVDFSIVCSSTVFVEYLLWKCPVFLYPTQHNYLEENWCKFHNEAELETMYYHFLESPNSYEAEMNKAANKYTETKNIRKKYEKCFEELLKE